jgi:heparosan-N-sulfate-glucuronate 5-epimerase
VRGYYIDLRMKASDPTWPPSWVRPGRAFIPVAQWGLACHERHLAGQGDAWLEGALGAGRYLARTQRSQRPRRGGWDHEAPLPHTYRLVPPWLSAMAQGQAASLLIRLYLATGEESLAEAARAAMEPLSVESDRGGVWAPLGRGGWLEEYPTSPPSFVLNGGIFALWGCYDAAIALDDRDARRLFAIGIDTLAANIGRWDTGFWSRYDLYPHPIPNVASSAYHLLHRSQLRVLDAIAPRAELRDALARFDGYAGSPADRMRALLHKSAFRLLVPRNQLLARRLPWLTRAGGRPTATPGPGS